MSSWWYMFRAKLSSKLFDLTFTVMPDGPTKEGLLDAIEAYVKSRGF
jgi:hypothetical protein